MRMNRLKSMKRMTVRAFIVSWRPIDSSESSTPPCNAGLWYEVTGYVEWMLKLIDVRV